MENQQFELLMSKLDSQDHRLDRMEDKLSLVGTLDTRVTLVERHQTSAEKRTDNLVKAVWSVVVGLIVTVTGGVIVNGMRLADSHPENPRPPVVDSK